MCKKCEKFVLNFDDLFIPLLYGTVYSANYLSIIISPNLVSILNPETGGVAAASNHIKLMRGSHQLLDGCIEFTIKTNSSIKIFLLL